MHAPDHTSRLSAYCFIDMKRSSDYLQDMGIKDTFHKKSIMVAIDELCGRNPEPGQVRLGWVFFPPQKCAFFLKSF